MGLRDKEIPLIARILAVADAFDAMTQDRVYRKALPLDDALTEIERNAGTQFDPEIAELFVGLIRERGENWLEEDLTG
jgi:HD-GYP domain-containing protein (c-di-GMP phosphodiesterase class II)